jgi:hypothetical protein
MQTKISQFARLAVLTALGFACAVATVAAQEMIRFEAPCKAGASSLRQTLVILDEAIVSPDPVGHPSHLRWTRPILDAADLVGPASAGRLLPRERLTIYLARRTTSDLSPLFVGCSPNMDSADIERLRADRSSLSSFLFGSVERELEAQRKSFDAAIRDAIAQVRKAVPTGDGPHRSGTLTGLLPPLRALSQSIDLSRGIPRIVILSPFAVEPATIKDTRTAREAGFAIGADAGLDLRRAEIVALGFSGNPGQHLQSHVEAFFLRSKGQLIGWRSDGLPQLPGAPGFSAARPTTAISPRRFRSASRPMPRAISSIAGSRSPRDDRSPPRSPARRSAGPRTHARSRATAGFLARRGIRNRRNARSSMNGSPGRACVTSR